MEKIVLTTCLASILSMAGQTAVSQDKPNVVLLLADDVGIEAFSSYGALDYKTPNIDSIGTNGVRFNHCYAQPLCSPSRVEIMTGRYNHRNYTGFGILDKNEKTFGNLMKDAGYVTGIVGKWQLGRKRELVKHFGFDEYLLWWLENKSERYNNVGNLIQNGEIRKGGKGEYGPDVMSDFALDFITRHKDKPFFLYYPMILVHDPFEPTPDSADKNRKKGKASAKANFVDMIHYMDKLVGKINNQLDKLGIRDNTILIFTGDNGTDPMITSRTKMGMIKGAKAKLTDAGTHVPLLVSWPAKGVKGVVTDDLVDFTDFLPTIVEAAGGKLPTDRKMDGVSFLPILKGEKGKKRDWVYSSYFDKWKFIRTDYIRTKRYKLYNDGKLYDIENDRLEENPIENPTGEALKVHDFLKKELAVVSKTTRKIPEKLYKGKQKKVKSKKKNKKK